MGDFYAIGLASRKADGFSACVTIGPNFSTGPKVESDHASFISVTLHLSPTAARDLLAQLPAAIATAEAEEPAEEVKSP